MWWKCLWLCVSPMATPDVQMCKRKCAKVSLSSFHGRANTDSSPSILGHLGRNWGHYAQTCGKKLHASNRPKHRGAT